MAFPSLQQCPRAVVRLDLQRIPVVRGRRQSEVRLPGDRPPVHSQGGAVRRGELHLRGDEHGDSRQGAGRAHAAGAALRRYATLPGHPGGASCPTRTREGAGFSESCHCRPVIHGCGDRTGPVTRRPLCSAPAPAPWSAGPRAGEGGPSSGRPRLPRGGSRA